MGRGIAQIAALGGLTVRLFDTNPQAVAAARDYLADTLEQARRKRQDQGSRCARLPSPAFTRRGQTSDLADCDVVIEAIVEKLEVKRELFRDLEAVVGERCILASNTSSLSITAIAAGCARSGARRGLSLLQSGAADEGRRSDRRPARRPRRRRRADGPRAPHGPHAGAREGHARLHRQSRRTRDEYRRPARSRAKASRVSPISTGSCASRPVSVSGRSNCST